MTTQEAIDHIGYFTKFDLGSYFQAAPTAAQCVTLLNRAQLVASRELRPYFPLVPLTLTEDVYEYNLTGSAFSRRMVDVRHVILDGVRLLTRDQKSHGLWSIAELELEYPAWMDTAAGTPRRAAQANRSLFIHPKPNAAAAAATNYVTGIGYYRDRTNDSSPTVGLSVELELPPELHHGLCYLAATLGAMPVIEDKSAWERMMAYRGEWGAIATQIRLDNDNQLLLWGTTAGEDVSDGVWM